jgi:hypothetical protein
MKMSQRLWASRQIASPECHWTKQCRELTRESSQIQSISHSHRATNIFRQNDPYVDVEQGEINGTFASATSSRWEANEELDALLNIILKPLPRFDRRKII